jgi:hemerythrin-like domain-containing protein
MYFPAAVERDGKRIREIVDRMEKEHVIFRGLLSSAADAAQDGAAPETAEYLDVYVNMLFRHIEIENKQLFKEIDFSQETRRELLRRFRRFENEELGEGFHEKYRNMAKELVAG